MVIPKRLMSNILPVCILTGGLVLLYPMSEAAPVPVQKPVLIHPYVEKIGELFAPPEKVQFGGTDAEWKAIERTMGTKVPTDYKQLIQRYGSVSVNRFLYFYNPFYPKKKNHPNWEENIELYRASFERYHSLNKDTFPPYWPVRNGLLPIGNTVNANHICWLTKGEPDEWTISVHEDRGWTFDHHEMGLAEFLYKRLTGEVNGNQMNVPFLNPPFRLN
jgi:hypothetical protein